ncbi:hypothetical protein BGW37DRAFT_466749 [Umbelopsis sp. PMI_123]|nr:hypothetical protein BGW37DRAFT_466749 [Umbelopsis sp. PMI_123]
MRKTHYWKAKLRTELEQRCHLLQKKVIEDEDKNQVEKKRKQIFERTMQNLRVEIEELKMLMDERHDAQIEAQNKAQKAELLVIEAQNENSRLLNINDELHQPKVLSVEKQIQELQKYTVDDMRLTTPSPREASVGYRIEELKAQLEAEAKSRVDTTRTIRNNERVIESQKKALKENDEQISRQQADLLAAEQHIKGLRSELDDLFVSEATNRDLLRSAEGEAKEAMERVARLERQLERFKTRGWDRSITASPSIMLFDRSITSSPSVSRMDKSVPSSTSLSLLDKI